MISRTPSGVFAFLVLALCIALAPLARAGQAPGSLDARQAEPADVQGHCAHRNVQTMAEYEACHHPGNYQRMNRALNISSLYLMSLGALLVVSLLHFGSLGWMPVLKGLGGLLAAWLVAQVLGAIVTGFGALALYFQARSGSLE